MVGLNSLKCRSNVASRRKLTLLGIPLAKEPRALWVFFVFFTALSPQPLCSPHGMLPFLQLQSLNRQVLSAHCMCQYTGEAVDYNYWDHVF